jgi:hypothetical protein
VGLAKLYTDKTPITAAGVLNDRVLTHRGTEYCGTLDRHPYELYVAVENIDHTRTKAKSPQTNASASASTRPCATRFGRSLP